jgi:hypothetical protein
MFDNKPDVVPHYGDRCFIQPFVCIMLESELV